LPDPTVVGRGQGSNTASSVTFANMAAPGPNAVTPVAGTYTPAVGDLLVVAAWQTNNTPPVPPASAPTGLEAYRTVTSSGANNVSLTVAVTRVTGAVGANVGTWNPPPANVDVVAVRDADGVVGVSTPWGSTATTTVQFPALTRTNTDGRSLGLRWLARAAGVAYPGVPSGDMATPAGTWQQTTTQRQPWGGGQMRLSSWALAGLAADVAAFSWSGVSSQAARSVTLEVGAVPAAAGSPLQGFDGTAWQAGALSGWSGSGWASARVWTGATWV